MDIDLIALILEYIALGLMAVVYIALAGSFLWLMATLVWDEIKFRRELKKRRY